jgi:Flp pilus assembly protein TadD
MPRLTSSAFGPTGPIRRGSAVLVLAAVTLTSACAIAADPKGAAADARTKAQASAPHTISGNYVAARVAKRSGDFTAAAQFMRNIAAMAPGDLDVQRDLFLVELSDGNIAEALTVAKRIPVDDKAPAFIPTLLAVDDIGNGLFDAANDRLIKMPDRGLNVVVAPLLRAWALHGAGQTDEALTLLKTLEATRGFQATAAVHRGLILDIKGDVAGAEAAYKAAEQAGGMSLRLAEIMIGFYQANGRADAAQAVYNQYANEQPSARLLNPSTKLRITTPRQGAAEALFGIGNSLRQEASRDAALMFGYLALHLRSDFDLARLVVADTLDAADRLEKAISLYRVIKPASEYSWPARLRIASALDRNGDTEAAIAELRAMASLRADNPEPLISLGDILRSHERFTEAATAYSDALKRIPVLERRHWTLLYSRGIAHERSGQWEAAEGDFLKALEFEPEQPYVLNYLGYSWVDQGINLERGRAMIQRAVELRPDDGYIVDSLGWVLFKMGDFTGAVRELERAVVLKPEDPTINDHLGDAYWNAGRREEARFQWRRALSFKPNEKDVARIQGKLTDGVPQLAIVTKGE